MRSTAILKKSLLLPRYFRTAGWILSIPGFIIGILRFQYDFKPHWLDVKVFAVHYSFFETKYFSVIDHNITDEIAGLFLLCGLLFLCFSCEKNENDFIRQIRARSLMLSFYANSTFLILSILFVYGIGFLNILIINLFSPLFFYFLIFSILLQRRKNDVKAVSMPDSTPS